MNYLTVKLIDDCYNAYSARIAFFLKLSNSKPSRTKLSRTNALFVPSGEQHYYKHDFIKACRMTKYLTNFCTVQYLLLVN